MNWQLARRVLPAPLVFLLLSLVLVATFTGCTQIDPAMSYQGRLLRPNGAPVPDGTYSFRYNLFAGSSGGTPVYTDTKNVAVRNGLFNSAVGSEANGIPMDLFSGELYLQVTVNGQALTPRQKLLGAPYAMSLAPNATIRGSVVITRSFAGYADTGSVLTVLNTNTGTKGGNAAFVVNQAAAVGTDRYKVAALQVHAAGGQTAGSPDTGSYAAIFQSNAMRGTYTKSAADYYAAIFDSNLGISITGGGACTGCTLAYGARNEGDTPIAPGDLLAAIGVVVDPDLQVPILLVRRAAGAGDALIGVAGAALQRSEAEDYLGTQTGGFDGADGPAAPGGYLQVVVSGLVQVKVAGDAPVKIGDRLVAGEGGAAAAGLDSGIAKALSEPDENGLVWAMVDAR